MFILETRGPDPLHGTVATGLATASAMMSEAVRRHQETCERNQVVDICIVVLATAPYTILFI